MKTIEYIKKNGLESLKKELFIDIKHYPGFFILNYNQLESPTTHPIVQECRGLILSENLEVVSRSFGRFFNYGETPEITEKMRYEGALAYEKLDGSLLILHYNQVLKTWNFATRKAAFAEGVEKSEQYTIAQLALQACGAKTPDEIALKSNLDEGACYSFEIKSPLTKVVKHYDKTAISLLAVIEKSGKEWDFERVGRVHAEFVKNFTVERPEVVILENEDHLRKLLTQCKNLEEGFVVHNPELDLRIKAKAPGYLAAAHLKIKDGQYVPLRAATLVATGEDAEWLAYNKADSGILLPYQEARAWLRSSVHETFEKVKEVDDQKSLAMLIKHLPFSGLIFQARKVPGLHPWDLFLSQNSVTQAKMILQTKNYLNK